MVKNDNWDYILTQPATDATYFTKSLIDSIKTSQDYTNLLCPTLEENPLLVGHIGQAQLLIEDLEEWEVEKANPDLGPGGSWKPENCTARYKVGLLLNLCLQIFNNYQNIGCNCSSISG